MNYRLIERCTEKALDLEPLSGDEALDLLNLPGEGVMPLMAAADRVRRKYKGDKISLCSIVNARSGRCPEDCAFCSQSVHATSEIPEYPLMGGDEMVNAAESSIDGGAHKFGIVTSGKDPGKSNGDFSAIIESVKRIRSDVKVHRCASLGVLTEEEAVALREAGIQEIHHNLETARSFYPAICSTRPYDENVATVRAVKNAGMRVCCGGIFGMGESPEQRVELAQELRELDVDSIPLNFLNPIKGTRLENIPRLRPLEVLKIIATYRLCFPDKDIKVAGGREVNLRDLQSFIFFAGANSTMVGNYLTTLGRKPEDDLRMIEDLELKVVD